jgi:hypothetical protein
MNPLYSWPHLGSMFSAATVTEKKEEGDATPGRVTGDATPGTTLVNMTSKGEKAAPADSARV